MHQIFTPRRLLPMLAFLAMLIGPIISEASAEGTYQPGHGIDLGPFNLAGYSNLIVRLPNHGSKSLTLDDLSLYVSGHFGRFFNPFFETELTGLDLVRSGGRRPDGGDGDLVLERFYNDANLTDSFTLRIGKMLSPVGEWNEMHAAPLVLTAIRPAVTHLNFSEYATGFSILFSDPYAKLPDVQVYWQPGTELSERPKSVSARHYDKVSGAHINFPTGLFDKIGFSYQQAHDTRGFDQSLFGVDFHATLDKLTVQGEATYSDINSPATAHARDTEWGAYAAVSYALNERWSVLGWYEAFADRTTDSTAQDILVGTAYRPRPAMVVRLEYLQNFGGDPVNPSGLFASWSVLF